LKKWPTGGTGQKGNTKQAASCFTFRATSEPYLNTPTNPVGVHLYRGAISFVAAVLISARIDGTDHLQCATIASSLIRLVMANMAAFPADAKIHIGIFINQYLLDCCLSLSSRSSLS
jgi:hypothetical protein